jgi:hypothetical protein
MKEIIEILKAKDVEIGVLKTNLKFLKQETRDFKIYKALVEDGAIYVNYYSQDCDGVESYGSCVCKTIEEYRESKESFADSVEGKCSWEIVSKENLRPQEECGSYGQGWGIN